MKEIDGEIPMHVIKMDECAGAKAETEKMPVTGLVRNAETLGREERS